MLHKFQTTKKRINIGVGFRRKSEIASEFATVVIKLLTGCLPRRHFHVIAERNVCK